MALSEAPAAPAAAAAGDTGVAGEPLVGRLLAGLPRDAHAVLVLGSCRGLVAALRDRGCSVVEAALPEAGQGVAGPDDASPWPDGAPFDAAILLEPAPGGPADLRGLLERLRPRLAEKGRVVLAVAAAAGTEDRTAASSAVVALSEAGFVVLQHSRGPDAAEVRASSSSPPAAVGAREVLVGRRDEYRVREYRAGDEIQILPIFEGSFYVRRTLERWSWEYRENPHGNLTISEGFAADGQLVAHYAGYPVRFRDRGEPLALPALQVGDTFTLPAVRHVGRGPTSLLGRTVKHFYARFCDGRVLFNYGFNTGNIQRFSMAFVGARRLEEVPFLVLPLGGATPPPPSAMERLVGGWSVARVDRFDGRFDELLARVGAHHGLLVERDARYLDWRYARCPDGGYVAVEASRRGRLAGWGVFRRRDDRLLWGDALVDPEEPQAARLLLAAALAQPELAGATSVETWGSTRPPWWRPLLLGLGFEPRPEPAGIGLVFVPFALDPEAAMRERLYYTLGDSDLF